MERLQRLIIGISGASGITYAVRTLELLRLLDVETHLIISQGGGPHAGRGNRLIVLDRGS
jgi:4-hydroxy-3-polyprenylbenzoate decarboxylase